MLDNDKRFSKCIIIFCHPFLPDSLHKTRKFRVTRNNFNFSAMHNNSLKRYLPNKFIANCLITFTKFSVNDYSLKRIRIRQL